MNLGILNKTVILIDTNFLNEIISWNLNFYTNLYPNKKFEKINLADLLYRFAPEISVEEPEHTVDILFAYTLDDMILKHCEPNNMLDFIDTSRMNLVTDRGTFLIQSFFGDEGETCSQHYMNMLRMVNYSPQVSQIIMIADNRELNDELEGMYELNDKSLFLFKKYRNSEIQVPIKYVNVNYIVAYALGLERDEL